MPVNPCRTQYYENKDDRNLYVSNIRVPNSFQLSRAEEELGRAYASTVPATWGVWSDNPTRAQLIWFSLEAYENGCFLYPGAPGGDIPPCDWQAVADFRFPSGTDAPERTAPDGYINTGLRIPFDIVRERIEGLSHDDDFDNRGELHGFFRDMVENMPRYAPDGSDSECYNLLARSSWNNTSAGEPMKIVYAISWLYRYAYLAHRYLSKAPGARMRDTALRRAFPAAFEGAEPLAECQPRFTYPIESPYDSIEFIDDRDMRVGARRTCSEFGALKYGASALYLEYAPRDHALWVLKPTTPHLLWVALDAYEKSGFSLFPALAQELPEVDPAAVLAVDLRDLSLTVSGITGYDHRAVLAEMVPDHPYEERFTSERFAEGLRHKVSRFGMDVLAPMMPDESPHRMKGKMFDFAARWLLRYFILGVRYSVALSYGPEAVATDAVLAKVFPSVAERS